jgi:3-keto-5-aminohexanoate cleavage enzyme
MIVNLTPTGMVPTKEMTPHVPISTKEIVDEVRRCCEIGITMVHLHARDDKGAPTYKKEVYGELIGGIREFAPELVICVSLSGRRVQALANRMEPLELSGPLKPDMGSLTLSSLNFSAQGSFNDPGTVKALAQEMGKRGILPELEIFDLGMANYANYLVTKDLLRPPHYANIFLGNVATAQLDLAHAGLLIRDLPKDTLWSLAGIGDAQLSANTLGIAMGGGVRVGLEDAIHMDVDRKVLATNAAMVERVKRIGAEFGKKSMAPAELRRRLNLAPGRGAYGR